MDEIKNAQITSTMLGREEHGIMTFMIFVKFDKGIECGIGGYALDSYDKILKKRVFKTKSMEVISKILDVVGVNEWEKLNGSYIRIKDNGWGSTIDEIGNLMDDKWLNFKEFFETAKGCDRRR